MSTPRQKQLDFNDDVENKNIVLTPPGNFELKISDSQNARAMKFWISFCFDDKEPGPVPKLSAVSCRGALNDEDAEEHQQTTNQGARRNIFF